VNNLHIITLHKLHNKLLSCTTTSQSPSSDTIIVRFRSRAFRDSVIKMRRKLKGSRLIRGSNSTKFEDS